MDAELSQLQPQDLAIEKVNMIQAKGVWPKGVWPEFNVSLQHSSVYYSTKPKQHTVVRILFTLGFSFLKNGTNIQAI